MSYPAADQHEKILDLATHCIRCGFCLESCPTFTETGDERESPRGRIYLVRSAVEGKLRWEEDVRPHLDQCLGCRACETACPSGVEYGAVLELSREVIERMRPRKAQQILLQGITNPMVLKAQLALAGLLPGRRVPSLVSKLISGAHAEAERPRIESGSLYPPLDERKLPPIRSEVALLEGCAMKVLFPGVHEATRRLLRRIGFRVGWVPSGCCGALHMHSGYVNEAESMARSLAGGLPEGMPLIVNSAGCGSMLKSDPYPAEFRTRVFDLSQFLLANGLLEALASAPGLEIRLTYHDACHLAHGQKVRTEPRQLLKAIPGIDFVELGESDTCCGSAGIYNLLQPKMARQLLERKWSQVAASEALVVALGNPGCHAWMAQASREHGGQVQVRHTAEVLEGAFLGQRNSSAHR